MIERPAGAHDRRGHHVGAVGDGRRPEDEHQRALGEERRQRAGDGALVVRDPDLADDGAAEPRHALALARRRAVEHRLDGPVEPRQHQPHPLRPERRHRHQRPDRRGPGDDRLRHAVGNDLHRRDHVARVDARPRGERRDGHALVAQVQLIHARAVDAEDAPRLGEQVHAAGRRSRRRDALPRHRRRHARRRLVLGDVARLEPRARHLGVPGRREARRILGPDRAPLLQHRAAGAQGVAENRAHRLGDRDAAELHPRPRAASPPAAPGSRSAISAGVRAPMRSPTGPRRRARSASPKPISRSRARRDEWVFCEPRQPT